MISDAVIQSLSSLQLPTSPLKIEKHIDKASRKVAKEYLYVLKKERKIEKAAAKEIKAMEKMVNGKKPGIKKAKKKRVFIAG